MTDTDYRTAFEQAPIGLVISRDRLMVACNQQLLAMFGARHDSEFADERIMKRLSGELFWCHVSGRALEPKRPHAAGIWSFEDLSARRKVSAALTPREREIAALLIEGLTSKRIGQRLTISPRTVDVYRARLMRKYGASTTPELVNKLLTV